MKKLFGVTTAMTTFFTADNRVDLDAMKELTNFLIDKGVNCLYPLGTTGEMLRLTVEERKAVAQTVVETAAGRVTVYIHVGATQEADVIELARHAHQIGADGIGVVTPQFFGLNDREMFTFYSHVAASIPADFPMYLYNIPQCAANDIKTSTAKALAEKHANIVGIKYSWPDFVRTYDYIKIRNNTFSVMQGADRLFVPALAMGCDGTVSGISCVYPEPFVAIYKAFQAGDLAEARKQQLIGIDYVETLRGGSNMAYFKEALKMRGLKSGHMRQPQLDLTPDEAAELKRQLSAISVQY